MGLRVLALAVALATGCEGPADWGASALLRPARRRVQLTLAELGPDAEALEVEVAPGLRLRGLLVRARPRVRRGLVLYLHGVGDNHASAAWMAGRLVSQGFDLAAYSARAHGSSQGTLCTYGYHERRDVSRVLDALEKRQPGGLGPVVLLGHSMGAAVALQAAPDDSRVAAVIAVAPFADLASAVESYRPGYLPRAVVRRALARAETVGAFRVAEVSPLRAVARLRVPLLLLHGAGDRHLPPVHSQRLLAAATAGPPARLQLIAGANHNDVLGRAASWRAIDDLLATLSPRRP